LKAEITETDLSFWEEAWGPRNSAKKYLRLPTGFEPILQRYLKKAQAGKPVDFLEIGCFPGRFLYFFAKEFGFRVHGVDFVPQAALVPAWLQEIQVEARVAVEDFFQFAPGRGYDVVASFGFVEHFANWEEVLEHHLSLLNPGGTLIIEMPNFRYGQYWLRRILNPALLDGHVLQVMDPDLWAGSLTSRGLDVLYSGYYQTFRFWGGLAGRGLTRLLRKVIMEPVRFAQRVVRSLDFDYPNRYFSPYIFIIARQPEANPEPSD
jgi:SAM-dependent methyltransferase